MALSYCPNWGTIQHVNQDMMTIYPQTQFDLAPELLSFHDNFTLSDTSIQPIFETNQCFNDSENNNYMLPKRHKFNFQDSYNLEFDQSLFDPIVLSPNPDRVPELPLSLPDFITSPLVYGYGGGSEENFRKKPSEGTLSAQSIAARKRRRKISEKTQELGKLVPNGQKMNTAEMFEAASKYIKFLRAQVGILQFMGSIQEIEKSSHSEELQVLVASALIQEKLCSAEKCLVPKEFVQTLAHDLELQSNTLILKEVNQLIQTHNIN